MKPFRSQKNSNNQILKEYSRLAENYDDRWDFYIKTSLQETLKRIDIKPGQKILDVGCGTGVLLETLSEKHPDLMLAGIEPTPKMLAIARKRLKKTVHLEQSWAERLPFENESFDVVISCNVFRYIREPYQVLQEFRRVLKPNGFSIITDWCDDYITCKIYDIFLRFFNSAHYKTYRRKECYDLLYSTGFKDIEIKRYKINWFWGMMTAKACKKTVRLDG